MAEGIINSADLQAWNSEDILLISLRIVLCILKGGICHERREDPGE